MQSDLCIKCRGIKHLCGLNRCPYIDYSLINPKISTDYTGISPPDIFIGHYGYPRVMVSALSSSKEIPKNLFPLNIDKILEYRLSLYRVGNLESIDRKSKLIDKIQEIAISDIKMGIDAEYYKIDNMFSFDSIHIPLGPRIYAKRLDVIDQPNISRIAEKIYYDTDLKATEGLFFLYKNGFSVDYLRRVMSAGMVGVKLERKLVPTRWAITAVDDIVGKKLIDNIKDNESIDFSVYSYHSYMWNDFHILILPGPWSFEMFENWYGRGNFRREIIGQGDYENYFGRKGYASNVTGAYYAARLAVLEYLNKIGKVGRVIVYREIGREYNIPLGVWIIRESVREALKNPKIFNETNVNRMWEIPENIRNAFQSSRTIQNIKKQKRLELYG
ncbi:MAG: hypothetical protein QW283_00390 [Thermoplasmata archaeon]